MDSWRIASGSFSAGPRMSRTNVARTAKAATRRREARADEAAGGQPDPAEPHDRQGDDEDADGRGHEVGVLRGDRERHQHGHRHRRDQDRHVQGETGPDHPARSADRRREDQVRAATTLVARPARHEEGAEEAEHHRGEAGEGQLQEPRRLGQVDLRIDLLDELEEVRGLLEDVEERGCDGRDERGIQADAAAAGEGDRGPVGQLAAERAADATREARGSAASSARSPSRHLAARRRRHRPRAGGASRSRAGRPTASR